MELILIGFTAGAALTWLSLNILRTLKTAAPVEPDTWPDCAHLWGKWELHKHGTLVGDNDEKIGFYETRRRECELRHDFQFKTLNT